MANVSNVREKGHATDGPPFLNGILALVTLSLALAIVIIEYVSWLSVKDLISEGLYPESMPCARDSKLNDLSHIGRTFFSALVLSYAMSRCRKITSHRELLLSVVMLVVIAALCILMLGFISEAICRI